MLLGARLERQLDLKIAYLHMTHGAYMRAAGGGTGMRSRRPRVGQVHTTEKSQEMPARRASWRVTHSSSSDDSQTTGDGDRRRVCGGGGAGAGAGTKPTVAFQ